MIRVLISRQLMTYASGIISFVFILTGCIEAFDPEINSSVELLVVDGSIIKNDSIQQVLISTSTDIDNPEYSPVVNCSVSVTDKLGNVFSFTEIDEGSYTAEIPEEYLVYGNEFRLDIVSPENKHYQSEWEELLESSPIDSIYSEEEYYQSSSEQYEIGLQFYADLKAPDTASKNYRWIIEETWEIHTEYGIDCLWEKGVTEGYPVYSPVNISVCWDTRSINSFYSSSTENLSFNEKKKIPLNFLSGTSKKINVMYSLLVKQYVLTDKAYEYINQNGITTDVVGGLYQTQPSQSKGNVSNVDDPDEVILGFFWASSYTEKRIFYDGPLNNYNSDCKLSICDPDEECNLLAKLNGLGLNTVGLVAVEYYPRSKEVKVWAFPYNQLCIDCTIEGGTTVRPDFWE